MKTKKNTKITTDEIIIDGRDVERAELLSLKRKNDTKGEEHTIIVDDELLTTPGKTS